MLKRGFLIPVVVGVVFVLAVTACGGGDSKPSAVPFASGAASTVTTVSSPSAAATSDVARSSTAVVAEKDHASLGKILVDTQGRVVYTWAGDQPGTSLCQDACAQGWPPVVVVDGVTPASNITGGSIGVITRRDGRRQVTLNGLPLYYYSGDRTAGDVAGNGSRAFGSLWAVASTRPASGAAPGTPTAVASASDYNY